METKFSPHYQKMVDHLEELFNKRLLTEEELTMYRDEVKYRQSWKTVGASAKRFVIGLAAVLVAIGAIWNVVVPWLGGAK